MENKKLGILVILISLLVGSLLFYYTNQLTDQASELGCYPLTQHCMSIEKSVSITHIAIGVFSFILALGFYLLFFNKTEKAILERLERDNAKKIESAKFDMLFKALDEYEQRVVKIVKEQDGITQATLRIKTDMSKAKLSYVLQELERRGIIKRIAKGRTLQVFLKL